jgi:hypothetical protein
MTLFVGLEGTAEELDLPRRNVWQFPVAGDQQMEIGKWMSTSAEAFLQEPDDGSMQAPVLFVSFPSSKDPTWHERHPTVSTCEILAPANWQWFDRWADGEASAHLPLRAWIVMHTVRHLLPIDALWIPVFHMSDSRRRRQPSTGSACRWS